MADQQNNLPQPGLPDDLQAFQAAAEAEDFIPSIVAEPLQQAAADIPQPEINVPKPDVQIPAPDAKRPDPGFYAQQPQQPQYGYQPPQQPYGYQQPPYGYPQQPQGYQQPPYGYPQQPQYGYGQGYPTRQPVPGTPTADPKTAHRKSIGSMVLMIIALVLLSIPVIYYLPKLFDALDSIKKYRYISSSIKTIYTFRIVSCFVLIASAVLMLVGAIRGSRGFVLFGIGTLLLSLFVFFAHLYQLADNLDTLNDDGKSLFAVCLVLLVGSILAGIGCLTRVKGLKIAGAIMMLIGFLGIAGGYMDMEVFEFHKDEEKAMEILGMIGTVLTAVAVIVFPLRKPKADSPLR